MPFSRRLSLAILSILLLTLITNGLAQPVHAQTTTVQATVIWVNGSSPRPDVALQLYRKTTAMTNPQPAPDGLRPLLGGVSQVSWTNLEQTDINDGLAYEFTVNELHYDTTQAMFVDGPPTNYTVLVTYTEDSLSAFVTNTFTSTLVDITASKNWVGGTAPRPSIAFRLYRATGTTARQAMPNALIKDLAPGTVTVIWTGLEANDTNVNQYVYTVVEGTWDAGHNEFTEGPPTEYQVAYSADGLTVTNTYSPLPVSDPTVKAFKVWVNGPKPTIWFKLYRQIQGGQIEEVPIAEAPIKELASGTTEVTWPNQTVKDANGNPYKFSVKEGTYNATSKVFTEGLTYYIPTPSTDGLTITNTYVIPKINITGYKVWTGGPAVKPNIQIQLYRNGVARGGAYTLTSSYTNNTWLNEDQTDQNGATYNYTIDEVTVPALYSKRVNGMTITNTYTGTLPYTGDNTHNARWLALLLGLSALLPLMSWLDLKLLTRRRG